MLKEMINMLIQNRSIYWNGFGLQSSSAGMSVNRSQMGSNQNKHLNKYVGEGNFSKGASVPNGYRPPYCWELEMEPKYDASTTSKADLSIYYGCGGGGLIYSPFVAGGKNIIIIGDGALHGYGTLTAEGKLILYAIATLLGNGQIASDSLLTGKLEALATLVGQGVIGTDTALGALAWIITTIIGEGDVGATTTLTADGLMEAIITPYTELSPQTLAAALWNALAADFNLPLTMGQKLNAAGSAGDPWITELPGTYTGSQAGNIIDRILTASEVKQATVNDVAATNLVFVTSLTETDNDFWNRGAILFTSGNNKGQIRKIHNYNGTTKAITLFTSLTYAPANSDTFIVLPIRCFRLNTVDITQIIDDTWDEMQTGHTTSGTFGEKIAKKLLTTGKFLALK